MDEVHGSPDPVEHAGRRELVPQQYWISAAAGAERLHPSTGVARKRDGFFSGRKAETVLESD
jgi:hypothetical protein